MYVFFCYRFYFIFYRYIIFLFYILLASFTGSYMSAHVLLNLLNEFGKKDKMRGFAEHLICLIQKHEYKILLII